MDETTCLTCGEPMRLVSQFDTSKREPLAGSADGGVIRLDKVCSNPDCMSHGEDGLAGPSTGDRQRVERLLDGDSGLADGR